VRIGGFGLWVDEEGTLIHTCSFTGTVKKVVFDLKPATTHDDEQALHEHESIDAVAHGISA
jgi:hypothetical protein